MTGAPGARAHRSLGEDTFDLIASEAIETGAVGLDLSPLDICLGVLPLAQLGLHFWYSLHSFRPVEVSGLLGPGMIRAGISIPRTGGGRGRGDDNGRGDGRRFSGGRSPARAG